MLATEMVYDIALQRSCLRLRTTEDKFEQNVIGYAFVL